MLYPGKALIILDNKFPNGIRFEGDEGWVFCAREGDESGPPLRVSDKNILTPVTGPNVVRWMPSKSHHGNWLESVVANRQPIEQSSRSLEVCAAAWIGMKLKQELTWDSRAEMLANDDAANALHGRKARKSEYDFQIVLEKSGIT